MGVTQIEESIFDALVINSNKKVVVDCYAEWCGPCQTLAPIVEEVSLENTDYEFYKLDVDQADEISMRYGIMSIPTLLVFDNGELVNKSVGFVSKQQIKDLLK
jgi:thioredoxin 1